MTSWSNISALQKISAFVFFLLIIGTFIYVPYDVPNSDHYEYSWIWKPVKYKGEFFKEVLDQIDTEDLSKDGIGIDPNWKENSKLKAHYSRGQRRFNTTLFLVLGICSHFAVGAFRKTRMFNIEKQV